MEPEESRFVRSQTVLWRQAAGVVLARTVDEPEIVELSGTGVLLWLALSEPANAADLTAELAAVTGVSPELVAPDIETALSDLVDRGLVTRLAVGR